MRIAYVAPRFTPDVGGVETHVARLAARVAAAGHDVEVLTQDPSRRLPPVEVADEVTIRRFPAYALGGRYHFAAGLWSYLARHGPRYDLIHAHSYHALAALGAVAARRVPVIFTPHYHGAAHSRLGVVLHKPYRLAGQVLVRRASAIICVSQAEAELLRAHFPAARSRVVVIPNGVDLPAVIDTANGPGRTILTVGRLEAYKGVDAILEALPLLPDFSFSVVGDGPAAPALRTAARWLGVKERVDFLGTVGDDVLAAQYQAAGIYASMSRQEAFGLTLADALAQRLPVVASDIPPHREVIELAGRAHASLIDPDAPPEELAEAIRRTADLGRSPVAPELPSWDAVAERTLQVYERVLRRAELTA